MIIVHAKLPIQAEKREEFLQGAAGLVAASNAEPGIVDYQLYESVATPNEFLMVERYTDADAVSAHLASPHFQAAGAALAGWLSGPPELVQHEADEGRPLPLG